MEKAPPSCKNLWLINVTEMGGKSLYILEIKTHLKYPIKSVIFRVSLLLFTLSGGSCSVHIGKTHLCDRCHVKREEIFTLRRFYYVHPFTQTSEGENICTPSLLVSCLLSHSLYQKMEDKCRLLSSLEKPGFPPCSRNDTLLAV